MSLQRRRELARLSKPELIDIVVGLEFARMDDEEASAALGLVFGCQESPDAEFASGGEVE